MVEAEEPHQDLEGGCDRRERSPNDFDFCQQVPSDASMAALWLLVEMGDQKDRFSRQAKRDAQGTASDRQSLAVAAVANVAAGRLAVWCGR
jgi:hypothetical protein